MNTKRILPDEPSFLAPALFGYVKGGIGAINTHPFPRSFTH